MGLLKRIKRRLNRRTAIAAIGVGGLIVVAAACQIEEHSQYRYCVMYGDGTTGCSTRVGLNNNPDNGTQYARLVLVCNDNTLVAGNWRQIIGTTSDYGQGTQNPEWLIEAGRCAAGNPVKDMAVQIA